MTFERDGFVFGLDRLGLTLEKSEVVEFELDYEELGIDPDAAPADLGAALTELLRQPVADDEGLFDLAVHRDGNLVATLTLSCEDDSLEVLGERMPSISEASLAHALLGALLKS